MAKPYVIGIDFGTLSARAVLVDARNGKELATVVAEYKSGVIEHSLPGTKTPLKPQSALQDPTDYLTAMEKAIPALLRKSNSAGPLRITGRAGHPRRKGWAGWFQIVWAPSRKQYLSHNIPRRPASRSPFVPHWR